MPLGSPVTELALLLAGVALLYAGAELLVAGARDLALAVGLKAATVGVTVVAFATTAPELFVAVLGGLTVSTDIGLGAILGSNVANIGLVLGAAALIRPLDVSEAALRRDVPFMLLAAALLVGFGWNGQIGSVEGGVLLATLVGFTLVVLRRVRRTQSTITASERDGMPDATVREVAAVVGGLVALVAGSNWLIAGGRSLLAAAGFSDLFVGLTVLAVGTSLPELASSVAAARRGEDEIAFGNVIGSNLFNTLVVVGFAGAIRPFSVDLLAATRDYPAMLFFTVMLFVVGFARRGKIGRVTRVEGVVLCLLYVAYILLLVRSG